MSAQGARVGEEGDGGASVSRDEYCGLKGGWIEDLGDE